VLPPSCDAPDMQLLVWPAALATFEKAYAAGTRACEFAVKISWRTAAAVHQGAGPVS